MYVQHWLLLKAGEATIVTLNKLWFFVKVIGCNLGKVRSLESLNSGTRKTRPNSNIDQFSQKQNLKKNCASKKIHKLNIT